MKLMKLLSRYFPRFRQGRSARRKTAFSGQVPFGLTDSELEHRVLLAGTTSDAPDASTAESGPSEDAPDPSTGQGQQSTLSGFDLADFLAVATFDNSVVVGNRSPVDDADLYTTPNGFGQARPINIFYTQTGEFLGRTTDVSQPSEFDFSLHTVNGLLNSVGINSLLPLPRNPLSSLQRSTGLTPPSSESSASQDGQEVQLESASIAEDSSIQPQHPGSPLPLAATDDFFSLADNATWAADFDDGVAIVDVALPSRRDAVSRARHDLQGRRTSRLRRESGEPNLRGVASQDDGHRADASSNSVSSISNSKTAISQLLHTWVHFDATEFQETADEELSDWLSQQLGLTMVNGGSGNADVGDTTNTSYADSNTSSDGGKDLERLQQAFLKIDFLSDSDCVVTILSDRPPEPPEIGGIWQRLRFDCNPRGPPVSDQLPGSEFTRQGANAMQLQQLRYSIAPRGPSVASGI